MEEKPLQTEAVSEPSGVESRQRDQAPWTPKVHTDLKLNTNPFENFDQSGSSVLDGASVNRSVTIRDASEDTAPLQGSKDVSDDDYLGAGT